MEYLYIGIATLNIFVGLLIISRVKGEQLR